MTKTVSVYIPTHNRPEMLDRALKSLLAQSYKDIQVLVCNDGSSKSYAHVVDKYNSLFNDFVYFENESPKGACFARNRLINAADGEYITGLDDDDEFLPTRIEDFVISEHLDNHAFLCAGHLTKTSRGVFKQTIQEGVITLSQLLSKNLVGNQVFTETKKLRESGGFDEKMPAWQDYDAWVMLTKRCGDGYKINKHNYRWNIDHEENRISNSTKAKLGYELFISKHSDILSKENLNHLYVQDIINRNDKFLISDVIGHFSLDSFPAIVKYQIKKMFPGLKEKIYKI
ncbi:glycosyltransferase [Pantoea coffeiphila]|uniref:Glycosyl transferase n=1 Tax=Pantoea coffeiphila TaxID=1465635 RepID=A0A2S9IG62_9GAMM|nr:glycosyltransferase [Pantoea coffeiphila]PRD16792.1 glycosyl transferase [Pantoea coffeiphila]